MSIFICLASLLSTLIIADEREIKSVALQSHERAAFILLKQISACTGSGKWEAFLEALRRAGKLFLNKSIIKTQHISIRRSRIHVTLQKNG
jgi:hypothetical protein